MRRYLLVLDMDLLAVDEELDLEPINHLVERQEQEPCEVVVMSLVRSRQAKLPAMELLLGAQSGKFPVAPQPDHDLSAAAENRMNLAIRHLKTIGCQASGLLSDEDDLVKAVRSETRQSRLRRGDPGHRRTRRLAAGPRAAPGPGSPAAAESGRAADRVFARPGRAVPV